MLRRQPRVLGLTSSTACLLLPHKPNPRPSLNPPRRCKIRPTSKMSVVSLETYENMAGLKKELGLALGEQQVESSSAGTPTFPSPRSAEAPQDEIQSGERSETTGTRPKELRDTCQRVAPRARTGQQDKIPFRRSSQQMRRNMQAESCLGLAKNPVLRLAFLDARKRCSLGLTTRTALLGFARTSIT
ncbi:hypothetical protein DL95DRAFT_418097 [Leptodontidium sp. 2 PMI_412]|nr:hypothetical protein DL95DRAFT_418097 [Leptodontidium sp. 2 PMI_412]